MNKLVEQIDALLPQTQCGQCGYAGCLPYAQAIAKSEATINRCPPGGVNTLKTLGALLEQDVRPFLRAMEKQEQPSTTASIREAECIGCTKCLQACPVDAILGASKQSHTVLTHECTGCGLCIAPCPVDCIDIVIPAIAHYHPDKARQRFHAKKARLAKIIYPLKQKQEGATLHDQRVYIAAAVARSKAKKFS